MHILVASHREASTLINVDTHNDTLVASRVDSAGDFSLYLRIYWPGKPVAKGIWIPPAIFKLATCRKDPPARRRSFPQAARNTGDKPKQALTSARQGSVTGHF